MTIDQIKQAKKALIVSIAQHIEQFERITKCEVSDIDITICRDKNLAGQTTATRFKVDIKLDI